MAEKPFYLKVLIVDDHFAARQLVANVMREHDVTNVKMAADGRQAEDAINAAYDIGRPFDIVFLDWNMPHREGIDVLKYCRAQPRFNSTAFIMVTAAAQKSEVLQAAKAGATSYIIKPVSPAGIAKKFLEVVEWVKRNRVLEQAKR